MLKTAKVNIKKWLKEILPNIAAAFWVVLHTQIFTTIKKKLKTILFVYRKTRRRLERRKEKLRIIINFCGFTDKFNYIL